MENEKISLESERFYRRERITERVADLAIIGMLSAVVTGMIAAPKLYNYFRSYPSSGKQPVIEAEWNELVGNGRKTYRVYWAGYSWDTIDEDGDGLGDIVKSINYHPIYMYTTAMKPQVRD